MDPRYGIQLILSFISISILTSVYMYLDSLKDCVCFLEKQNPNYKINIDFLKFYQILEIFSLFILIVLMIIYKKKIISGGDKKGIKFFITLTMILLLGLTGYMSYNSIFMYFLSKEDCRCVNKWQKYIVYIQGVLNTIYFLRILFALMIVLLIVAFNYK